MKVPSLINETYVSLGALLLSVSIFIVDLFMPVAFPLGPLYVLPVYFTGWLTHRGIILGVPILCTAFLAGAYVLAPQEGASIYATMNHILAVVVIWSTAAIAAFQRRLQQKVAGLTSNLEQKVFERTQELERSNQSLQELNQLKSAFVSVASHEIRTPVTAIKGFAENLHDGILGSLTPRQDNAVERILVNSNRLMRIIDELLNLAIIEAGQVQLRRQSFTADELINEILDGLKPAAERKSITIHTHHRTKFQIVADKEKLGQVLTNLVQNAIKFTPAGGHVNIRASHDGANATLVVGDTGPGIPPDELPKIFSRFYRGSAASRGEGAGLGLAIAKSLVELHGGQLRAESQVEHGSQFIIELPGAVITSHGSHSIREMETPIPDVPMK